MAARASWMCWVSAGPPIFCEETDYTDKKIWRNWRGVFFYLKSRVQKSATQNPKFSWWAKLDLIFLIRLNLTGLWMQIFNAFKSIEAYCLWKTIFKVRTYYADKIFLFEETIYCCSQYKNDYNSYSHQDINQIAMFFMSYYFQSLQWRNSWNPISLHLGHTMREEMW